MSHDSLKFDDNGIYHGIELDCRMKSLSFKGFGTAINNRARKVNGWHQALPVQPVPVPCFG
jgi:hypothetical protein